MYLVFRGPHHGPRLPHFPKTKGELKIKDFISNCETKKYLKISGDSISLDEEKIISDASWDGMASMALFQTPILKSRATP